MYDSGAKSSRGRQTSRPSRAEKDVESRGTLAYSFPYINRYSNRATFRVTLGARAAPSCDILRSLRASGPVMRHFEEPACQRLRHATFWGACVPAAPSCDILGSLRASGAVMRHFGEPVSQRRRHATFWRACVPASPSCDILGSLRASGAVMRHFEKPACQRRRHATFWEACVPAAPECDMTTSKKWHSLASCPCYSSGGSGGSSWSTDTDSPGVRRRLST